MKFGNLLKKELRQLINRQTIVSMAVTLLIFIFMGSVMGNTMEKLDKSESSWSEEKGGSISLVCCDNGSFVDTMFDEMRKKGTLVNVISEEDSMQAWQRIMEEKKLKSLVIIPDGFSESALKHEKTTLKVVTTVSGTGLSSMIENSSGDVSAVTAIRKYLKEHYAEENGIEQETIDLMNSPATTVELTSANGRIAEISSDRVSGVIMGISMIMPVAVFFLLMMASQMVMTAISTEKIDKTLETLLSAPVSRVNVLLAKVIAAIITALLNSVVMMIGFAFYMNGMSGGMMTESLSNVSVNTPGMDTTSNVEGSLGAWYDPFGKQYSSDIP